MFLSRLKSFNADQAPWQKSARLFSLAALLTLLVNLIFTIWAMVNMQTLKETLPKGGSLPLVGVLMENHTCDDVKRINTGIHVVVNFISAILLAGSNYCMQVLAAPTRDQVNRAHTKRKWLHIGVPSLSNLLRVGERDRIIAWMLLGASSLPLHLFYNSAVFTALSVNEYNITVVEPLVMKGQDVSDLPDRYQTYLANNGEERFVTMRRAALEGRHLTRLSATECLDAYSTSWQSAWGDLLLVGNETTEPYVTPDPSWLEEDWSYRYRMEKPKLFGIYTNARVQPHESCPVNQPYIWLCMDRVETQDCWKYDFFVNLTGYDYPDIPQECQDLVDAHRNANALDQLRPLGRKVEECYALPTQERCRLMFSPSLMVVVMAMNLLKCFLMFCVASNRIIGMKHGAPLLTIGDAIASFLAVPDESTKWMCLTSRRDFTKRGWEDLKTLCSGDTDVVPTRKRRWADLKQPKKLVKSRWRTKFAAAGIRQWCGSLLIYLGAIGACGYLYYYGVWNGVQGRSDDPTVFALGLGQVNPKTLIWFQHKNQPLSRDGGASLLKSVVVANSPQIAASAIYFTYNALVTTLSLASEWDRFARKRKAPRITGSVPVGQQRKSYFLQLPFRYSIPLIATSGVLHWLISQTLFVVFVEVYRQWLELDPETGEPFVVPPVRVSDIATCGWSPLGVVIVMALGGAMVVVLIAAACWPLKSNMPVAGSCSAAISAACHPPEPRDPDDWMKPLMWGDTDTLTVREGWLAYEGWQYGAGVENDMSVTGHCAFSSYEVTEPRRDVWYS